MSDETKELRELTIREAMLELLNQQMAKKGIRIITEAERERQRQPQLRVVVPLKRSGSNEQE
jgi:hypothetical protein